MKQFLTLFTGEDRNSYFKDETLDIESEQHWIPILKKLPPRP